MADAPFLLVMEHYREGRRLLAVKDAPSVATIDGALLVDVEYGANNRDPCGSVTFDGDVLTIRAINGRFRYHVDRRARVAHYDGEGRPVWAPFVMHRIDGGTQIHG